MARLVVIVSLLALLLIGLTNQSITAGAAASVLLGTLVALTLLKRYLPERHSVSTLLFPGASATFAQNAPRGDSGEVLISYHTYQTLHHRLKTATIIISLALALTLLGLKVIPVLAAAFTIPIFIIAGAAALWAIYSLLTLAPRGERVNALKALVRTDPRIAFARYAPTENTGALKVGYTTYKKLYRAASISLIALILLVALGLGREIYLARMSADQNFRAASEQLGVVLDSLTRGQGNLKEELAKLVAQSLQTAPGVDQNSLTQNIIDQVTANLPQAPTEIVKETTQTITERTIVENQTAQSIQLEGSGQYVVKDNRGVTIFSFGPNNEVTLAESSLFDIQGAWNIQGIRVTTDANDLNDLPTLLNSTRFLVTQGNDTVDQERILTAGSGITLTDAGANNAFTISSDPSTLTLTTGTTDTDATPGSVFFAGTGGVIQQDNANFFYDDSNNRLGIGTASPSTALHVAGTMTATNYVGLPVASVSLAGIVSTGTQSFAGAKTFAATSVTTLTLSSNITSNFNAGEFLKNVTTNTGNQYFRIQNLNTQLYAGIEGSDGGGILTNTTAYSTVLGNGSANNLHLGTNFLARLTISSDGNVGIGTTAPSNILHVLTSDAGTTTVLNTLRLERLTSGTAADGLGTAIDFYLEDAAGNSNQAARIDAAWEVATNGSEESSLRFNVMDDGSLGEAMRIDDNKNVGIGTTSPEVPLHVLQSLAGNSMIFESTDSGTEGPGILFRHSSASPAVNDTIGALNFSGKSTTGASRNYASISALILDPTNASEDGQLWFGTTLAGSAIANLKLTSGSAIFNDDARDVDFRIEGDTKANLFFVDASADSIIVNGTSAGTDCVACVAIAGSTAPSASITDGIQLFAVDIAGSHELRVRDEATNVTTLSPHNFSLFQPKQDYYLPWSYTSERDNQAINVDMYGAIQQIEYLSGEHFIYGKDLESGDTFTPTNLSEILSVPAAFAELDVRFAALEERITTLEASPHPNPLPVQGEGNDDLDLNSLIIRTDVTIYGTLLADTLEIATALNLHGDATIWGSLLVKGDVEFEADARVAGSLTRGNERTGQVTIPEGVAWAKVQFTKPFASAPNVTATLLTGNVGYKITGISREGFTITLTANPGQNATFAWIALVGGEDSSVEVGGEFAASESSGTRENNDNNESSEATEPTSTPTPAPTPTPEPSPSPSTPLATSDLPL